MSQSFSSSESRALELLGQGLDPSQVGPAVGLTVSRISQLLSDPEFSAQVAELRFKNLSKHNARDSRYDDLEDKLLEKMENLLVFMMKPMEVLAAIKTINAAKRRGASAPDHILQQQTVINLTMPTQIINQFKVDSNKQVIQAGTQTLITAQSGTIQDLINKHRSPQNALPAPEPSTSSS